MAEQALSNGSNGSNDSDDSLLFAESAALSIMIESMDTHADQPESEQQAPGSVASPDLIDQTWRVDRSDLGSPVTPFKSILTSPPTDQTDRIDQHACPTKSSSLECAARCLDADDGCDLTDGLGTDEVIEQLNRMIKALRSLKFVLTPIKKRDHWLIPCNNLRDNFSNLNEPKQVLDSGLSERASQIDDWPIRNEKVNRSIFAAEDHGLNWQPRGAAEPNAGQNGNAENRQTKRKADDSMPAKESRIRLL